MGLQGVVEIHLVAVWEAVCLLELVDLHNGGGLWFCTVVPLLKLGDQ